MGAVIIDAGQMTARLQLQRPVSEPDGQGGATVSFETVASLWARIEPVSQSVVEQAATERVTISHRIWLQYRDGLAAGMRLVKSARVFRVKTAHDPDETRRFVVCSCTEEGQ